MRGLAPGFLYTCAARPWAQPLECMYICIYVIYVYMYICIYVYMYICIYAYMLYVYMYMCIYVYMYMSDGFYLRQYYALLKRDTSVRYFIVRTSSKRGTR